MSYDFGFNQEGKGENADLENKVLSEEDITDIDTGNKDTSKNGEKVDDLDDNPNNKDKDEEGDKDKDKDVDSNGNPLENKDSDSENNLPVGSTVDFDNNTYTIDESGNLVDSEGKVFKEAKDVNAWLKEVEAVEDKDENEISINSIQSIVGVEIVDEENNPVEFDNTPEGVKSYVQAVIDTGKEEIAEATLNGLYEKYPIVKDVLSYYIANGNSLEGFGEMPDRSNITIDDTDEAQQENIIRAAWKEQNRGGDVESYIAYLKNSGSLLAVAKNELAGLQESDKQKRVEVEAEAKRIKEEHNKELETYWNGVHDVIKNRKIAGYQIPDSMIINRNGRKLSVTPEDFFNYLYKVDENGKSAYQNDLEAETPESRRDDEILRAYLKFSGGNYSNLVNMAINKDNVEKLRLRAKQTKHSQVKITKPNNTKNKDKIDFGY